MKRTSKSVGIAVGILTSFYFFGWLGSHSLLMETWLQKLTPFSRFMELTPLNLFITAGLLFYFYEEWSIKTVTFMAGMVVCTFLIEMVGVQTGEIFGDYRYGSTLGWKLWETPLLIGVNWLVVAYCSCQIAEAILGRQTLFWRAVLASLLMTFLDYLIEPVAVRYDMWDWAGDIVPLQNYVAWWIIGFLCCWTAFKFHAFSRPNPLAFWVYGFQVAFFMAM